MLSQFWNTKQVKKKNTVEVLLFCYKSARKMVGFMLNLRFLLARVAALIIPEQRECNGGFCRSVPALASFPDWQLSAEIACFQGR